MDFTQNPQGNMQAGQSGTAAQPTPAQIQAMMQRIAQMRSAMNMANGNVPPVAPVNQL